MDDRPEIMRQFAEALGLHEEFAGDVMRRGQAAIIDRCAEEAGGALPRILRVAQRVGDWIDGRMPEPGPPNSRAVLNAVEYIARDEGVPEDLAVDLFGPVWDAYGSLANRLAYEEQDDAEQVRTVSSGA